MIYFIFTPSLRATQGQWYSCWQIRQQALSLPGFFPSPLRRSVYGRKQLTCEQGLLGTNPEAVSVLDGTGWPWVPVFSLHQASVSLFVKKKWFPRGDFYGPLSTLSATWPRGGFLPVPWHPNSSNGAFALLFLWLLMPFYFLALSDIPFPDLAGSSWSLFSCSSVWFQKHISGSQVFKHPGLPRMVTLQAHAWWRCSGPAFWTGSWTVVLLPQPLLWCACSPWYSEVPQCQSWVRAERIAGAGPIAGWRRRESVEPGSILNWIYSFWRD